MQYVENANNENDLGLARNVLQKEIGKVMLDIQKKFTRTNLEIHDHFSLLYKQGHNILERI